MAGAYSSAYSSAWDVGGGGATVYSQFWFASCYDYGGGLEMQKNTGSQKVVLLAIDVSTNAPKTGDAANLTAYVSKDWGAVTVLGDTSATELDATNAPGLYAFDLTQTETNADELIFSGKSSTANVKLIPRIVQTVPASFSTLTIANNAVDADLERIAGSAVSTSTAQLGVNVVNFGGSAGTFASGRPEVNTTHIAGTAWASTTLFTLASHDPGETIMGATDLGTGSGFTSLATAAELAKVPKSDSNVTWNATALASIQAEANDALVANNLDHLLLSAVDTNFATTVHLDSVIGHLADAGGTATFDRTTDALEVLGAGVIVSSIANNAITAAAIATGAIDADAIAADAITDAKVAADVTIASVTGAVGSVTGNVGGNVTGSVGSIATGGIAAASFAAGAIDAAAIAADAIGSSELAASAATEIADAILSRNVSNVESTAAEHTLCTVVLAMLENSISGTTLTIKRTDGSTTHATKTLTTDAAADPITGIN